MTAPPLQTLIKALEEILLKAPPGKILHNRLIYPLEYLNEF